MAVQRPAVLHAVTEAALRTAYAGCFWLDLSQEFQTHRGNGLLALPLNRPKPEMLIYPAPKLLLLQSAPTFANGSPVLPGVQVKTQTPLILEPCLSLSWLHL